MSGEWSIAATLTGASLSPLLTRWGLSQLARQDRATWALWLASSLGGGVAGAAAVATWHRTNSWQLAPILLIWGCALVAAASCDAVTQRIPTPLVRQAGVATCLLLIVGLAVRGDWGGLLLSGVSTIAAGFTMLLCWRFAGAGYGDVRLAVLGGLGLGHANSGGLLLGLAVFAGVTCAQVGIALARGGNRETTIPYGPALAAGFLLAATL
ncbi:MULTISPECIES: peptidase [unclassified Modestobacter]|uniref:peptidase n=1 Tax=unclassified Modestobacter TaxID=2643866 RepID=UPI0022AACBBF|nr:MULTISPECIES: peptidase [unclassified Modestobacter]MCZ2812113.1 peptidase [Modestobacter sp. VKM Ac-2979]MCZ2843837.1 peptidase [Modestobacter sp. VKM Ac-2980]MCZ2849716.1 peptidase [Modestobacter sp. VKM Ac-2978]